jgi:hypothetical protein
MLSLPCGTVIAGPSAAYLYGIDHAAKPMSVVHVIAPAGCQIGQRKGIRTHRVELDKKDVIAGPGVPRTTPPRTAWDAATWLPTIDAVPIVDTMLGRGFLTDAQLAAFLAVRAGSRGSRLANQVFGLADGGAQSVPESVLRVRFVLAGLPRPVTQYRIILPNGATVYPDITWPRYRVAAEYDGLWHGDADQFHRDRRRLNQLVTADWIVLHVTAQRLYKDFDGVLQEVKAALRSRGWRG